MTVCDCVWLGVTVCGSVWLCCKAFTTKPAKQVHETHHEAKATKNSVLSAKRLQQVASCW